MGDHMTHVKDGRGRPRLFAEGVETAFIGPVLGTAKMKSLIDRVARRQGVKPSVIIREALRRGLRDIVREMREKGK